jgi:hypothetical protein
MNDPQLLKWENWKDKEQPTAHVELNKQREQLAPCVKNCTT